MRIAILLIVLTATNGHSGLTDKFYEYSKKVIGESLANKVFDRKSAKKYELPTLPKISKDKTSTSSYNKRATKPYSYNKLTLEKRRPYELGFLKELNLVVRDKTITAHDAAKWLNVIEQGGSREGVYRALVLDRYYSDLEGMDIRLKNKAIVWLQHFCQTYLDLHFSEKKLSEFSLHLVKRLVTEKSLELSDAFENENDLHMWFSILSSDLAHQGLFESRARSNQSVEFYLAWSKGVPPQHLKSELIIKIHKLVNSLNKD